MRHAQVYLQTALQPLSRCAIAEPLQAVFQLALDNIREQLVLGCEVAVEGPASQPDGLHQTIYAGIGEASALGQGGAAAEQFFTGQSLVFGGVAHGGFLLDDTMSLA